MFFLTPYQAEQFLPTAYNSFAGEFSETRQRKWSEFDDLARADYADFPEAKILDIGCGNGRLRKFLEERGFVGKYYARDVAENFLDHAKQNLQEYDHETLTFSQGGFLDLREGNNRFSDAYFDEVWAVASFHHLSRHADRKKALADIHTVLKPEGEIVLTVWNLWEQQKYIPQKKEAFFRSVYNPFFSARDFLIPWGTQKTPRYYYSFSQSYVTELLAEAGFAIQKIFYSDKKRNLCVRAKKMVTENGGEGQKFLVQDIPFDITTEDEVLELLVHQCPQIRKGDLGKSGFLKVYTPNPEMLVEIQHNTHFKEVLQRADLSLADGNGILWASGLNDISHIESKFGFWKFCIKSYSLLKYAFCRKSYPSKIKTPICGSDIFRKFLESTKGSGEHKIFLLGGEKGSAEYIQKNYPQICGVFDGMVNVETIPEILDQVTESGANILFVALGAPKQEIFIDTLSQNPKFSGTLAFAMGVGGSFDFISGHQKRAPKIFRTLGIEWVYRLIKHPERAGRIWNATGKFIGLF